MHSRPLQASAAVALAGIVLGLGYLGMKSPSPVPAAAVEKLSLALSLQPQNALLHIAMARNFFAEEGLEVTFIPVSHGKAGIERVLEKKADLAIAAEVPFVIAVANGEALSILANLLDIPEGNVVIARRDRGIAVVADLAGKRVGVSPGTSGEYFLWSLLIRYRLALDSVTQVDLLPGELAPALALGTIDAAATWQPHVLEAQRALGNGAVSFADADVYSQATVLVARSAFLRERRSAIEKLLRALLKAERLAREQPEESVALVAAWLGMDADAVRPLMTPLVFRVDLAQSQLNTLEDEARWAMVRGYAATGPVPNFLSHLYLDALLAVKPERVTVVR